MAKERYERWKKDTKTLSSKERAVAQRILFMMLMESSPLDIYMSLSGRAINAARKQTKQKSIKEIFEKAPHLFKIENEDDF